MLSLRLSPWGCLRNAQPLHPHLQLRRYRRLRVDRNLPLQAATGQKPTFNDHSRHRFPVIGTPPKDPSDGFLYPRVLALIARLA
jgi:hypothetical protein